MAAREVVAAVAEPVAGPQEPAGVLVFGEPFEAAIDGILDFAGDGFVVGAGGEGEEGEEGEGGEEAAAIGHGVGPPWDWRRAMRE